MKTSYHLVNIDDSLRDRMKSYTLFIPVSVDDGTKFTGSKFRGHSYTKTI